MKVREFFQSKIFKTVVWVVVGLVVCLLVFAAGVSVGFRKANFSYKWGENYHKNFGGPRGGFFKEFRGGDFIEGYGTAGQIIKIDDITSTSTPSLVIKGTKGAEKIILIKDATVINRLKEALKSSDLKVDDYVVIIGKPNEAGQIEAKLIRIMPAPQAPPPRFRR